MLNDSIVSFTMSNMQKLLVKRLERDGYIYPTIILMNEKGYVPVEDLLGKFTIILLNEKLMSDNGVYATCLTVRNRDENDDLQIEELIREITFRHRPDAIGYFSQCLYKPMTYEENLKLTTNQMNLDPDAIRVLHNCYFVKGGDPRGFLMVTPYIKNELKRDDMFDPDVKPKTVVTQVRKTWESPSRTLETRIKNPYL